MCYRVVERFAVCHCVYFVHGVDQCSAYGQRGHQIEDRVLLVGHTCPTHAGGVYSYSNTYASHPTSSSVSSSTSLPAYEHYFTSAVRGVVPEYLGANPSPRDGPGFHHYY